MKKQTTGAGNGKPVKVTRVKTAEAREITEPAPTDEEKQAGKKKEFKLEKPDITFGEK
jgi:hypothetical protein